MSKTAKPATIVEANRLFWERLGWAISRWQPVEIQIFRVFVRLIRCEEPEVASAAFHTIVNFNTKLAITAAAANVALSGSPLLKSWRTLSNRVSRLSKRRNALVHFLVLYGFNKPVEEHGPHLQPNIYDVTRAAIDEKMDYRRIQAIGQSFERLERDIADFVNHLPVPASSVGKLF